jgi:hypothetical protein
MNKIKSLILTTFIAGFLATPTYSFAATLSLSPSTGTFNRGCSGNIQVIVDTEGVATDGTDAILTYEVSRFSSVTITNGTIYNDYPGNNVNSATGKITISGLASVSQAFTGKGTLATINFVVAENAPAGSSTFKFDFDPNDKAKTTDSNIVERGTTADVLSSVIDGNFTVGTGACGVNGVPGGAGNLGGSRGAASNSGAINNGGVAGNLPPAGSSQLTYTIAILGATLTILGILGMVLL